MDAELIAEALSITGHKWIKDDVEFFPTAEDVQIQIDRGITELSKVNGENIWIFGGIVIYKNGLGFDIYVQVGRR